MWKPFSSVPKDGTIVDLWSTNHGRIPNMRFTESAGWVNIFTLNSLESMGVKSEDLVHCMHAPCNDSFLWDYNLNNVEPNQVVDILIYDGTRFTDMIYDPGSIWRDNNWFHNYENFTLRDMTYTIEDVVAWMPPPKGPKSA